MQTTDKLNFVDDLCTSIMQTIKAQIRSGAIPQEWDGIELRQLLADKFEAEAHRCKSIMGRKRVNEYRNAVIVNNL